MNIYPPPDNPNLGELTLWCRDFWAATTTISGEVNIPGDTTYGVDKFFLITEKGHFNIAAGATLTIYSPEHILASPRQQIFTGSGIVAFTVGGDIHSGWWGSTITAINNAITSAPATSAGRVLIPPGTFTGNLVASSKYNLTIKGAGSSTIISPSSGIGVAATDCTLLNLRNIQITGGDPALSIHGANWGILEDITIQNPVGDGIYVDGDDPTEMTFKDVTAYCGNNHSCFHYARTTTTDTGGIYLDNVRVHKSGTGTGQKGFTFESTAGTTIYAFLSNTVADGFIDNCYYFDNVRNICGTDIWASTSVSGKAAVYMKDTLVVHLLGLRAMNWTAGGYILELEGGCQDISIPFMDCGGNASRTIVRFTSFTGKNLWFPGYRTYDTTATFTNDMTRFAGFDSVQFHPPIQILTNPAGTSTETFGLYDFTNSNCRYFRNNGGVVEFLDTTFAVVLAKSQDDGDFELPVGGKGVILTNAAGNVTKRVRLNDAGDGLIFDAP